MVKRAKAYIILPKPIELGSDAIAVCFPQRGNSLAVACKGGAGRKEKRIRTIETREAWAKGGGVYSFLRGDLLGGGLKAA